jgi:hypothetical protein
VQYAIKLERASKKGRHPPSEHEANVLRILADADVSPRIPRVIDYGYDKPSHSKALVLELLGDDIQSMRKKSGGRLSIKTTLVLALQLVCIPIYCSVSLISHFTDSYDSVYPLQRLCPQRYKTRKHAFRT